MERPKGVDVRTVNADINPVKSTPKKEESKKKLNLNPSTIKKVNRAPKKDATPTRKKVVAKTKNKKKVGTRKREKLIDIEKRK